MLQLRDYQIDISNKACKLLQEYKIAYLSMQVRCGKTLTALQTANNYLAKSVLFITTKKAKSSIENDFSILKPNFQIEICNYESLHTVKSDFDLIVVDEAHKLGQFPIAAERTKKLKELCKGKPIIYLSGTPTPESYSQIYHQFWISEYSPFSIWTNFYKWAAEFVNKKKKYFYNREVTDYSNAKQDEIEKFCKHLFISYTQEEAGFKQQVKEEIVLVQMKEETYNLADKMRKKRVHIGTNSNEILADTEVKLMQKLHQIYSGTVKSESGNAICFDKSKIEVIKEKFKGKKIAIYYKFIAEGELIRKHFKTTSIPEIFNNSKDVDLVFVSQIQSGREGVDLHTADCLIMYNIDFSATSYLQAKARIQAKNKTAECLLYWLFSDGGIEQKIYKAVLQKKDYTLSWFVKDYNIKKQK